MPAERRSFPAKPVKTERTHEENQERAYIAASRRSDRSLEARIESARRASEIHKKRTGRALRVTEQDVVNEEMYEEEDDDIPTQYQRLSAHLHTSSVMFNRKLHDYIATQHGVRSMFLAQYQNHPLQPGGGFQANAAGQAPQFTNPMGQNMLPPQLFNQSQQMFMPPQSFTSQGYPQQQQQGYRHAPYAIPQRPTTHQRSASIPTPLPVSNLDSAGQMSNSPAVTTPDEVNRRMSLPPQALEKASQSSSESQSRPGLSRSTTSQSIKAQPTSPGASRPSESTTPPSTQRTPPAESGHTIPTSYSFAPTNFATSSQVLNMNPLSMSLPPESQQFVGSVLDPNDPRTSIFMAGSDNLAQPFMGTYSYNPNLSPKSSRMNATAMSSNSMTQTLAPDQRIKLEPSEGTLSTTPPSVMADSAFSSDSMFLSTPLDYSSLFDSMPSSEMGYFTNDQDDFDDTTFLNFD